jgi:hypothetical protein
MRAELEAFDAGPDKVRWKGENEAVPVMGRAVFETELVIFALGRRCIALVLRRFYGGQIGHVRSQDREVCAFLPEN